MHTYGVLDDGAVVYVQRAALAVRTGTAVELPLTYQELGKNYSTRTVRNLQQRWSAQNRKIGALHSYFPGIGTVNVGRMISHSETVVDVSFGL